MPEEVLYILFIAMVAVIMVNIVCAFNHKRSEKDCKKWKDFYYDLFVCNARRFWLTMGAYEAAEGNKLYLDLEGIRLVIDNGEIEGWYIP